MNPDMMQQPMGGQPQGAPMAQPDMTQSAMGGQPEQDLAPFEVYEQLRQTLQGLLFKGLPGAEQLLAALDKIQSKNIAQAGMEAQGGTQGVTSPQASSQYGQAPQ